MSEFESWSASEPQPSARSQANRALSLSAYAGSCVMLCLFAFGMMESHDVREDIGPLLIAAVASLSMFGIGYSTSQR